MVQTTHFKRKPFYVDGVRVTKDNMEEVAAWCGGLIKQTTPKEKGKNPSFYIEVQVHRPVNDRQSKAFVGDWVLKAENGFKVYTHLALQNTFEEAKVAEALDALKAHLKS